MPPTFMAGVDIGASNMRVIIVSADGAIEARRSGPLPNGPPDDVVTAACRTIDELVRSVWIGNKVSAVGVALPGTVDSERGRTGAVSNLPRWDDQPIVEMFRDRLGAPVVIENDANAAAVGEGWFGAAKGLRDYIFVAYGTGLGAGVVLNGAVHRGAHLFGGEIGLFPMTRDDVRQRDVMRNCLESRAGGYAIAASAVEIMGADGSVSALFDAAYAGESAAATWLREMHEYIAMAVCEVAALLDPEAVIFGGGVMLAQGERFLAPIRTLVHERMPVRTDIVLSTLGDDAQALGAVKLALDSLRSADLIA